MASVCFAPGFASAVRSTSPHGKTHVPAGSPSRKTSARVFTISNDTAMRRPAASAGISTGSS